MLLKTRRSTSSLPRSSTSAASSAQFGTMAGEKLRSEHLRVLLGVLILLVAARMAFDLVVRPEDLFSLASAGGS